MKYVPVISINRVVIYHDGLSEDGWKPTFQKVRPDQVGTIASLCAEVLDRLGEAQQHVEVLKTVAIFQSLPSGKRTFFQVRSVVSAGKATKESRPVEIVTAENGDLKVDGFVERMHDAIVETMQNFVDSFESEAVYWKEEFRL